MYLEAVQAFFAQFKQSTSTVNLQIVTPEVFQWLYTHNLLNSYRTTPMEYLSD